MKSSALLPPIISSSPSHSRTITKTQLQNPRFRVSCSSVQSELLKSESATTRTEYKPGVFDDFFLNSFRNKLVQEVGLDSEKPGYDGLIELANRLMMKGKNNSDTSDASLVAGPDTGVTVSSVSFEALENSNITYSRRKNSSHDGWVTALTCQWLMGPCTVNSVDLPDGNSCQSGVFVERCKYLEESKCVGVCIKTCKLPTQTFFKDYMGVPLLMEPNFSDYSCQFKFGILPPEPEEDAALKESCLEICPTSSPRKEVITNYNIEKCPKA